MKKEGRKFGKKTREGIFAGYKCNAGGGWSGAYYVIDAQRFQNKPANIRAHLFTVNEVYKLPELSFQSEKVCGNQSHQCPKEIIALPKMMKNLIMNSRKTMISGMG
jgi:hypothetical protein